MDHAGRRRRLTDRLDALGADAFLVSRVVNVRYLTGFTGSNGQLLALPSGGVFFTDGRYTEQCRREVADLRQVIYARDFRGAFAEACQAEGVRRVAFEESGVTYRTYRELSEVEGVELVAAGQEVERLRWSKDAEEIRLLEEAQALTDEAFGRVVPKLVEGVTERAIASELEVAMRDLGAERIGFDTIVAFGESAAEPHHRPTERPLARRDVVKMDFGCVLEGYHSDMTRTVAFGDPDPQLREVYQVVLRAQLAGIDAVHAGTVGGDADVAARAVIRDAGYGERFGHSLGHGVGLEIHEGPTLRNGSEDVLPERSVVTVEPGIYLPGTGGVRIEDAVVAEREGARPLPRTPKDLLVL